MSYNTIFTQGNSRTGTPIMPRVLASPLMTPRTVQLYAFGESASGELDKVSSIFNRMGGNMQPPTTSLKNQLVKNIFSKGAQAMEPQVIPRIEPQVMQQKRKGSDLIMNEPQILQKGNT
jgi:hypothetical protein